MAIGTATGAANRVSFFVPTGITTSPCGSEVLAKPMAKAPTFTIYSDADGAVNACRDQNSAVNRTVSGVSGNEKRINQLAIGTAATAGGLITFNYTADTRW